MIPVRRTSKRTHWEPSGAVQYSEANKWTKKLTISKNKCTEDCIYSKQYHEKYKLDCVSVDGMPYYKEASPINHCCRKFGKSVFQQYLKVYGHHECSTFKFLGKKLRLQSKYQRKEVCIGVDDIPTKLVQVAICNKLWQTRKSMANTLDTITRQSHLPRQ